MEGTFFLQFSFFGKSDLINLITQFYGVNGTLCSEPIKFNNWILTYTFKTLSSTERILVTELLLGSLSTFKTSCKIVASVSLVQGNWKDLIMITYLRRKCQDNHTKYLNVFSLCYDVTLFLVHSISRYYINF